MGDELDDILAHPAVEYVEWVHRPNEPLVEPGESGYTDCCEAVISDALRRLELCGVHTDSVAEGIAILYRQNQVLVARIRELEMTKTERRELSMDW